MSALDWLERVASRLNRWSATRTHFVFAGVLSVESMVLLVLADSGSLLEFWAGVCWCSSVGCVRDALRSWLKANADA